MNAISTKTQELKTVGYRVCFGSLTWLSAWRLKAPWIKRDELVTKADAIEYSSAQVEQSLDIRMHGLNITDGKMALELGTDMAKIMAEAYLGMLDTMGAVNYCELEMHVGDGRKLLVTVQRLERPTAHDLRLAAEAKFDALLLQVAAGQTGDR